MNYEQLTLLKMQLKFGKLKSENFFKNRPNSFNL